MTHNQNIRETWYLSIITMDDKRISSSEYEFKSKLKGIVYLKRHKDELRTEHKIKEFRFSRLLEITDDDIIIIPNNETEDEL